MLRADPEIVVWGSGNQTRTFQYERDTAGLMIELMKDGHSGIAYNLGGFEISIRDLVYLLAKLCDYKGRISFDTSKPEGPARKAQDVSKMLDCIRNGDRVSLKEGLEKTIEAARKAFS
jgi:GDP-L-fucose synthase